MADRQLSPPTSFQGTAHPLACVHSADAVLTLHLHLQPVGLVATRSILVLGCRLRERRREITDT